MARSMYGGIGGEDCVVVLNGRALRCCMMSAVVEASVDGLTRMRCEYYVYGEVDITAEQQAAVAEMMASGEVVGERSISLGPLRPAEGGGA